MLSAVGAIFYTKDTQRSLFLLRSSQKYTNTWGLVGGKIENNESVIEALIREITEEIGFLPNILKYIPLETFTSNDHQFQYHTYVCVIEKEFIPLLNHEHCGWSWTNINNYPRPLHPGFYNSISSEVIKEKLQVVSELFKAMPIKA